MVSSLNFGKPRRKKGSRQWLAQRVSAVLLMPTALWFVWGALPYLLQDPLSVRLWFGQGGHALGAAIWTLLLFWHGFLGMRVVVEDYLQHPLLQSYTVLTLALFSLIAAFYAMGQIFFLWVTVL